MASKINKRLIIERKKKNCSKKEMAHLLGLKYTTYCRMEEKGNITGEWLLKISEILGIDVRVLLYDEFPQNKDWQPSTKQPDTPNKEPEIILGYKYINQSVTVMENKFLELLRRLPLKEQQEIFNTAYNKISKQ